MRITRIEIEGGPGRRAAISRNWQGDSIDVVIFTPEMPQGRRHSVLADCREDVWSMAECLQFHMDGVEGTNGDKHGYFTLLEQLMD